MHAVIAAVNDHNSAINKEQDRAAKALEQKLTAAQPDQGSIFDKLPRHNLYNP